MYKRRLIYTFSVIIFLSLFAADGVFAKKTDESIVATINGEKITESELYFYLRKYGKTDEFKGLDVKKEILDKLIDFKIMLSVSKKYGEDKRQGFKFNYDNYLRLQYSELFQTHLAKKINVTQDDIDIAFADINKSDKRKTKEEIKEEKENLKKNVFLDKFKAALKKEIEKLKKSYNIKVNHDLIKSIDSGEDVDQESVIYEVSDEKISYARLLSMVPANVRHSSEERKKKQDFLYALIDQEVEVSIFALEAIRLKLNEADIFFHLSNQEYYEKLLVNMLDYNKTFNESIYGKIKVTDDEIIEYYNNNREVLDEHAVMLRVQKLQFTNEEQAKKAHEKLKKGAKIEDIAKGDLTNQQWDLGFMPKRELKRYFGDEASNILYNQKIGEVSDVIKVGKSYVIVTFPERNDEEAALENVKPAIRNKIMKEKSIKAFEKYMRELKKKADISINEEILKRVSLE